MAGALHLPTFHMPSMPGFSGDDEEYTDVFEEMTLVEHLDELRSRLVKTCIGIGIAFIVGLFLTRPMLGIVRDNANVERFDVIDATEPITDFFKTALYIAIAFALPLIRCAAGCRSSKKILRIGPWPSATRM